MWAVSSNKLVGSMREQYFYHDGADDKRISSGGALLNFRAEIAPNRRFSIRLRGLD